jgi:hypothetical protein
MLCAANIGAGDLSLIRIAFGRRPIARYYQGRRNIIWRTVLPLGPHQRWC